MTGRERNRERSLLNGIGPPVAILSTQLPVVPRGRTRRMSICERSKWIRPATNNTRALVKPRQNYGMLGFLARFQLGPSEADFVALYIFRELIGLNLSPRPCLMSPNEAVKARIRVIVRVSAGIKMPSSVDSWILLKFMSWTIKSLDVWAGIKPPPGWTT